MGTVLGNALGCALVLLALVVVAMTEAPLRRADRDLRSSAPPPRTPDVGLDPYEVAYLKLGPRRLIETALVLMHAEGRLVVRKKEPAHRIAVESPGPVPQDDMEAMALEALAATVKGDGMFQWPIHPPTDDPRIGALRERLVRDGLLCDAGLPPGVLRGQPAVLRWEGAHAHLDTAWWWVGYVAAAGAVVAYATDSYLPLLLYPLLMWAGHTRRRRYRYHPNEHVSEHGHKMLHAVLNDEWLTTTDGRIAREVAWRGRAALAKKHPLNPPAAPAPPPQESPREPEIVISDPPSLGGLGGF
ncbi:TIGR04222 domain-containing membrane protein [Streptomyces sp. NPDC005953]|uniref:TIGR04222 domain-containing membrane protein n=1 Tax=Streptomyces sp. NPDC005953 TaxID=3156719 RepID=UPI0033F893B7